MRKILKKIVTVVASFAMIAGLVVGMPTMETKAEPAENAPSGDIYVEGWGNIVKMKKSGDVYTYQFVTYDTDEIEYKFRNSIFWTCPGYYEILNSAYENFKFTPAQTGRYELTLNTSLGTWSVDDNNTQVRKYSVSDDAISITYKPITASEIQEEIDAIGTVDISETSYDKLENVKRLLELYVSFGGGESDITNLSIYRTAREKYKTLKEAADAEADGEIIVYVQRPEFYLDDIYEYIYLYGFSEDADGEYDELLTDPWPGNSFKASTKNTGWYKSQFTTNGLAFFKINDVYRSTVNVVNKPAGTYWCTILPEISDTYGVEFNIEVSTVAPEGWVQEETSTENKPNSSIGNKNDNNDNKTTNNTENNKKHDVTVKVKVEAEWKKAYLYLWKEGSEGPVAWPGIEMKKEGDFYTYRLSGVEASAYNMIINNGSGEQTVDIKNIDVTGDSVEITVSANKNENGKFFATSSQQHQSEKTDDATPAVAVVLTIVLMGLAVIVLNARKAR